MATHDVTTGLGGLDASIMFETERDENVGSAFNGTFGFTNNYYSLRASAADLVALAVVIASKACHGPDIPFRAGRIDAIKAGPLGVPKPDQDVETHTNIFAAAGFNTSDMIAMVACGHTLGGVHGVDFPEITGNDSGTNFEHFETGQSFSTFDNAVVTEYLNDSTSNPLVVGTNDTFNSDKRVFGADGNATMRALADPATFMSRCSDILGRMIDTVPASVKLTKVVTPVDVKPYIQNFYLTSNNTLYLMGRIRVRTTHRNDSDLAVHLTYLDRDGTNATSNVIEAIRPHFQLGQVIGFGEIFTWYEFTTTLPVETGISLFHVHLTTPSTEASTLFDNAGHGFPLTDDILYQQPQSCQSSDDDVQWNTTVVAAVRAARAREPVHFTYVAKIPRQGVVVPRLEAQKQPMERVEDVAGGAYVLFSATKFVDASSLFSRMDLSVGKGNHAAKVEFQDTGALLSESCTAL